MNVHNEDRLNLPSTFDVRENIHHHDQSLIKMFIYMITHVVDTGVDWSMLNDDAEDELEPVCCSHICSKVINKLTFSTSLFITNRNIRPKKNKTKKSNPEAKIHEFIMEHVWMVTVCVFILLSPWKRAAPTTQSNKSNLSPEEETANTSLLLLLLLLWRR